MEKAENASSEKAEKASSAFSDGFLLRLRATSNLTNMDYARFTMRVLPGSTRGVRAVTQGADEPRVATRFPDFGAPRDLLNVLSHARFVWLVEGPEPRDDRGDDRTAREEFEVDLAEGMRDDRSRKESVGRGVAVGGWGSGG